MANIKSAKKRIKVINRQKAENKLVKATIATYTKKFRALVAEGNLVEAEAKLRETISLIDSAASKGVLHKNNASRKVARLTAALANAKGGVAPVAVAEEPKKVEAKKPATKKVAEKVEAVEEKPAKKTTTKKATTKKAETAEEPAKKATKSTTKKTAAKKAE